MGSKVEKKREDSRSEGKGNGQGKLGEEREGNERMERKTSREKGKKIGQLSKSPRRCENGELDLEVRPFLRAQRLYFNLSFS